jgi:hypothetical protein
MIGNLGYKKRRIRSIVHTMIYKNTDRMHPLIELNMARRADRVCLHRCVCMSFTDGRRAQGGRTSSCVICKESSHFLCCSYFPFFLFFPVHAFSCFSFFLLSPLIALFSQRFISISANNKNRIYSLSRLPKILLSYFLADIVIHIFFLYIIYPFYHILSLKKTDRASFFFPPSTTTDSSVIQPWIFSANYI